jgi:hypothetical protein
MVRWLSEELLRSGAYANNFVEAGMEKWAGGIPGRERLFWEWEVVIFIISLVCFLFSCFMFGVDEWAEGVFGVLHVWFSFLVVFAVANIVIYGYCMVVRVFFTVAAGGYSRMSTWLSL